MQLGVGLGLPYNLGKPAAAFSPLDLSPVLWLDASDTSTITEVGGAVSQWDDKSGNGNHATQGVASAQPTSGTRTIAGLNVVDFDGTADYMTTAIWTSIGTRTVFVVGNPDATDGNRYLLDGPSSGERSVVGIASGSYVISQGSAQTGGTADTVSHIFRAVFDTTDTLHVDGASTISANAGTNSVTRFRIATYHAANAAFFDGAIAEIILVDGALTAGEIADTESYLASKWGITL